MIFQFLPDWGSPWKKNGKEEKYKKSIDNFTCGNRKTDGLHNQGQLDFIKQKLRSSCESSDDSYIKEMFPLLDKVLKEVPAFTSDHKVFSLSYEAKQHPSADEVRKYSAVKKVVGQLRLINTPISLRYALFLLVIVGVIRYQVAEVPALYDLQHMHKLYPDLVPDVSTYPEVFALETASMPNPDLEDGVHHTIHSWIPSGSTQLINYVLDHYHASCIESIGMAFHGGEHWFLDVEKRTIFQIIEEKNIPLRILLNSEEALKNIWCHTSRGYLAPGSLDSARNNWGVFQNRYPNTMEVRVSDIPLMHRMYLIRLKDGTGIANIAVYTYGDNPEKNTARLLLSQNDPAYTSFIEEFDYLWGKATTVAPVDVLHK